jgi:hypothetical protein
MPALLEVQRRFADALRSAQGEGAMLPLLVGDADRNRALLGIYRGNSVANASAALALAEPVRELPYLPDVARLEWSVHVAAMAADAVPLGGAAFAGLDADSLCAARLGMMPGFALHGSVWPIADIWLQHQQDAAAELDIDLHQPQRAVVWRDGLRVRTAALGVGAHAFWAAAALAGACIGDAWTGAALHEPAFNLAATIEQSITSGWLQAVHTGKRET